jgi:ABC-type sulfate transport system substrate-binding protein
LLPTSVTPVSSPKRRTRMLALLFLDYIHSKEGQQFIVKGGLSSPRDDVGSLVDQKFKKTYFEAKYSVEEYEKKVSEWEGLIQKLLMRRR